MSNLIRVPVGFVESDDGVVAPLLTPDDVKRLTSQAAGDNQALAEVSRDRLALDEQLGRHPSACRYVALFRRPTWEDRAQIESDSTRLALARGPLTSALQARVYELPLRVQSLLDHVETEAGERVGGLEVLPDILWPNLGAMLDAQFSIGADLRSFLSPPPQPSPAADAQP